MNVLLTGAGGQLGRALVRSASPAATVTALGRAQLDVADAEALERAIDLHRPAVVVNASAYTQVDAAEAAPQAAERTNADGARALARACNRCGAHLVHVSTDYVFDGASSVPYAPSAPTRPLSVYGASKRRGEEAILEVLGDRALIVRTSWLYAHDGRNFVTRMLELMREREELKVVADQIGAPTSADGLAATLWRLAERRVGGLHHWSDAGVASWYDFSVAIGEEGLARGLLARVPRLVPIPTSAYPTPAVRPRFSVLDRSSIEAALGDRPPHWRVALRRVLDQLLPESEKAS